jgi:hypothetical protein
MMVSGLVATLGNSCKKNIVPIKQLVNSRLRNETVVPNTPVPPDPSRLVPSPLCTLLISVTSPSETRAMCRNAQ